MDNVAVINSIASDLKHGNCLDQARRDYTVLSSLESSEVDLEVCLAAYDNARARGHWALQHLAKILPLQYSIAELEAISSSRARRCA